MSERTHISIPTGAARVDNATDITIGSQAAASYLNALIGITRLYNLALTAQEAKDSYNENADRYGLPSI
jgi:hypothetical protein